MIKFLSFNEDLKKIFNFSVNYHKTNFKKDIYHLTGIFIFSFIGMFIFFFVGAMILHNRVYTLDVDISTFEDPFMSGILFANIIGIIFSDLVIGSLTIICVTFLFYEYFWLIYSKSFECINSNNLIDIPDEIKTTKHLKINVRLFIGSLSSFLVTSIVIVSLIFVLRKFFLSFKILNGPNAAFSFVSVIAIVIGPFILAGYFLFPTLIYPIVLIVENKSYLPGLKKVFHLFSGKKNKLKFLILFMLLFCFGFTVFGFLIILVATFFIILQAISFQDLIPYIIIFAGLCSIYIVFYIEMMSNLFSNLYAQTYITLITHTSK